MHRRLEEVLGPPTADALMAHLPPVTWSEVATKDDLRTLETVLRAEMAAQGSELRSEISRAMERQIRWMVAFNTALVAAGLAAARLLF